MATSIGGIFATLGANVAGWTAGMDRAQRDLAALQGVTVAASARITGSISSMVAQVGGAVGVFGGLQGLTFGVKLAAEMEQTEIAFAGLMGSTTKAKAHIADLQKFAASTPFNFRELVKADRQMFALGLRTNDTIGTLRILGDAVAATGGNNETLSRLILAFGQMNAKGKVSAQEMNQIAETGLPGWKMLADAIGVSIPQAMKLAESGAISSGIAIDAMLSGLSTKFGGNMAKQAKSLQGAFSNLVDVGQQQLTAFGATIAKELNLTELIKSATAFVSVIVPGLQEAAKWSIHVAAFAAGFAGYAAAARTVGAAIWVAANATRAWAIGLAVANSLMGPAGIIKMIAAAGAAYGAIRLLDSSMKAGEKSAKTNAETTKVLTAETKKLADSTKDAATQAKALKASQDEARRTKVAEDAVASAITPLMKYNQAQADLRHLLNTGKISWVQYDAAMRAAAQTYDDATVKSREAFEAIQDEINAYGLAGRELKLFELIRRGATDADIMAFAAKVKYLNALDEEKARLDAIRKSQEEMAAEGRRITEDNITPLERYADEMEKLRKLTASGAISAETAERAAKKLRSELERPIDYQGVAAIQKGSQEAFSLMNRVRERAVGFRRNINLPNTPNFRQEANFAQELEAQQIAARNAIGGGIAPRQPGTGGVTPAGNDTAGLLGQLVKGSDGQNSNLSEIVKILRDRANERTFTIKF